MSDFGLMSATGDSTPIGPPPVETTLFAQTRDGHFIREFPQATVEQYTFRRNAPGACIFSLPAEMLPGPDGTPSVPIGDVLDDGAVEIGVRRGANTVWLGPLWTVEEDDDGAAQPIRFGAEGLWSYARKWHVVSTLPGSNHPGGFEGVDQAFITKALLDHHQSKGGGDFGIDTSTIAATGVPRDRTEYDGWRGVNIFEAVNQLADAEGGFDFDVWPATRQFRLHYPRQGRRRSNVTFNPANIVKFGRHRDATRQASAALGFGDGQETLTLRRSLTDSSAVARYGLTETVVRRSTVSSAATLDALIRRDLESLRASPNLISLEVKTGVNLPWSNWWIGDDVRVVWPSPYRPVDDCRRIVGIDVRPHPDETVTVHLDTI